MSEFNLNLDEEEPAKQPNTVVAEVLVRAEPQPEPKPFWPFIGMLLAFFLLGFNFHRLFDESPLPPDDRRETVEPVDPKPQPNDRKTAELKSITLVVIHDKDVTNDTKEYAASLADDQFADWCKANIKDLEVLPTEDDLAKQILGSGNLKVPVVIAYTGKKYLWDAPLPKGGMEPIRKKLEGK